MRLGIQGWGSEGDLRPLLALGARARQAGHDVRLVLSPVDRMDWRTVATTHSLPVRVVPEQLPDDLASICAAAQSPDPSKVSRALMDQAFFPHLEAMYESALELCAQSEVVVGLFSSWYVKAACLKTGTPFVALHYYPGMIPTREAPPELFPRWRWLAPLGWWAFGAIIDLAFGAATKRFFASKGLPIRRSLTDALCSERLNLVGCSPSLFRAPADWGDRTCLGGDLALPAASDPWEPSPALRAFLDEGEKPVLVSFGTLEHLAPARARELITSGLRLAGVRALVQTKCGGPEGRDGEVFWLRWAPHSRLLPQCSAMVLHGGAGTTHAALRGGVPAVVVPFIFEQGLWGGLLHRAGSAPKPLSFWKATPEQLAARIREAVGSAAMAARARELAEAVAREDGAGNAVARLERLHAGS